MEQKVEQLRQHAILSSQVIDYLASRVENLYLGFYIIIALCFIQTAYLWYLTNKGK